MSEWREVLRVTVPWDVGKTTQNALRGLGAWRRKAQVTQAARDRGYLAWQAAGCPRLAERVRVRAIVRRGRCLDDGSCWDGAKPVLDGVCVGWLRVHSHTDAQGKKKRISDLRRSLLPGDGPKWLRQGEVEQETGKQWVGREEIVLIFEREEESGGG